MLERFVSGATESIKGGIWAFDEAEFFVSDVLRRDPKDFFGNFWSTQIHLARKECDQARSTLHLAQPAAIYPREVQLSEEIRRQLEQQCGP